MNTRQKIIGLAALPLAGLLAAGGTAVAQASGSPAGTHVVQQRVIYRAVEPGPSYSVTGDTHPACQRQARDRDCGACGHYHPTPAVKTVTNMVVHARHDGTCRDHADR